MKTFFWAVKLLLFFFALTFALKNTDVIIVRYYLGVQWQTPLIFVVLAAFGAGAAAGVFAGLPHIVRLRREISNLRKKTAAAKVPIAPTPPRIADAL
ncbi:MAG TPA: lipopolysaccharide assembly protein LapA domain-containing protein [Burkholderiales bacterium]|nr:lipopolysaccharide assembly protein LapA domain-containing protein [Burkholderiales bacterium]